jgi:adenine-specific DNA-methyltransferase
VTLKQTSRRHNPVTARQMSARAARVPSVEAVDTVDTVEALIARTEERRVRVSETLHASHRADLGQFFTPSRAAALIAGMPRLPASGSLRVLDPGAGVGSLTAALIARVLREAPALGVEVVAVEVAPTVAPHLEETLADCRQVAASAGVQVTATAVTGDLITETTGFGRQIGPLASPFDLVIMNPPYRKLAVGSMERQALIGDGVDCPNLYCAFLAVGVLALKPEGQLVAITPRSFANGPYFGAFRRFFLAQMALDRLHVFESRSTVFADSDVLQENIVFSATRSAQQGDVTLSVSRSHTDEASVRSTAYSDVVKPSDPGQFIHIPTGEDDRRIAEILEGLPCKLPQLQLQVSTGKVVDFRAREYLLDAPADESVPLIYPGNLRDGRVQWPLPIRKAQALVDCAETAKLMLPAERYVLVKRFSSKEERRRVVAVVCESAEMSASQMGFENHLNVFHYRERGLEELLARGLCLWLNSSVVDTFFRTFSGHTQVNATDLRAMRYPSREQLIRLGDALGPGSWPDQEKTDSLVDLHIFSQAT